MHFAKNFQLKHSDYTTSVEVSNKYLITTGAYKPEMFIFDLESGDIVRTHALQSEVIATLSYIEENKHIYILLRKDNRIEFQDKNGIFYILKPLVEETITDFLFDKNTKILYLASKTTISSISLKSGKEQILLRNLNNVKNLIIFNEKIYIVDERSILTIEGDEIYKFENILRGRSNNENIFYLQISEKKVIEFNFSEKKITNEWNFEEPIIDLSTNQNLLYVLTNRYFYIFDNNDRREKIEVKKDTTCFSICGKSIFLGGNYPAIDLIFNGDSILNEYDLN